MATRPVVDHGRCEAKRDACGSAPTTCSRCGAWTSTTSRPWACWASSVRTAHRRMTAYPVRADQCDECGLCVTVCPEEAITLVPGSRDRHERFRSPRAGPHSLRAHLPLSICGWAMSRSRDWATSHSLDHRDAPFLQDIVDPHRAVRPGAAPSADRDAAVRLGDVVLVELRGDVQRIGERIGCAHGAPLCPPAGARYREGSSGRPRG